MNALLVPFVAVAALLTACVQAPAYPDRMDRSGYRSGGPPGSGGAAAGLPAGIQVGPPGGFGGPAPRFGVDPVPRLPPGLRIYPRNGQSWERARDDEKLCVNTAANEPQSAAELGYYERTVVSCLENRGYSVR